MTLPNTTGFPDYGSQLQGNITAPVYDPGEQTTRLMMGGGASYRSGRIVWATGFENGLESDYFAFATGGSTGYANPLTSDPNWTYFNVWQGSYALAMRTGAVIGNQAFFFKYLPASIVRNRWGFEAMVNVLNSGAGAAGQFTLLMELRTIQGLTSPLTGYDGQVRINVANRSGNIKFQVFDRTAGAFVTFVDLSNAYDLSSNSFYAWKLVADFNTGKYVSFSLGPDRVYDLSAYSMPINADDVEEGAAAILTLRAVSAAAVEVAVDNVILTGDEP